MFCFPSMLDSLLANILPSTSTKGCEQVPLITLKNGDNSKILPTNIQFFALEFTQYLVFLALYFSLSSLSPQTTPLPRSPHVILTVSLIHSENRIFQHLKGINTITSNHVAQHLPAINSFRYLASLQ